MLAIVTESLADAREKHHLVARLFYRRLLGSDWEHAMLGWAYLKCVDNAVDDDPDPERALACIEEQRAIARGGLRDASLPAPSRYGVELFRYDRSRGSHLRPYIEAVLDTMKFDVENRHRVLSAERIRRWALEVGSPTLRYLGHFASAGDELPAAFVDSASLAYLHADCLIDVAEDLLMGVIRISSEDLARYAIAPKADDPGLEKWIEGSAPAVFALFDAAFYEVRRLSNWRLRFFARLVLGRKRAQLRRFLDRRPTPKR